MKNVYRAFNSAYIIRGIEFEDCMHFNIKINTIEKGTKISK